MRTRWISDFGDGHAAERDLLGGKGAGLADMTGMGLRVPPGFTVTTDACHVVMESGRLPSDLADEVSAAVQRLEAVSGRTFGRGPAPLLLSVRSGAKFSMPGMMDTVLDLGMNDEVADALADWSGDEQFALDAYRRFIQMYANVVLGVGHDVFEQILTSARLSGSHHDDSELTATELKDVIAAYRSAVADAGMVIPDDPFEQLMASITAVFSSWNRPRAIEYRRINRIDNTLGTAANVQMMVYGDLGSTSGTGVCFSRDPGTGERRVFGEYLPVAQGEDVVSGARTPMSLDDFRDISPDLHAELLGVLDRIERHTTDMCDVEFTVERGTLWILQTRAGKRTASAAVRIAVEMVDEGLLDEPAAINRVDPAVLEQLTRPRLAEPVPKPGAKGVAASPGAAQGIAVFDSDRAVEAAADGATVLLIRPETTPDDIGGMNAADGILTAQGGKTSHAAVVARGMGKPAVTGVGDLVIDLQARTATLAGVSFSEGDVVTIDGTSGGVFLGRLPLVEPRPTPELARLLTWADGVRRVEVWANADTPADAAAARTAGAEGIGLARTEHMFLGERLAIVRQVLLGDEPTRLRALEELRTAQVGDFEGLLEAMDGLPVVIRLLDPPLHEFLPSLLELQFEMAARRQRGEPTDDLDVTWAAASRWAEDNPMLGMRGVRLGLVVPDLYRIQIEAAVEAVVRRLDAEGDPRLEIMVPLTSDVEELRRVREMITEHIGTVEVERGVDLSIPIGTMIELPRAALTAAAIATEADFFSFGTNDLTQTVYGLSRDDVEASFLGTYVDDGVYGFDPFRTIDPEGVGRLMSVATREGRAERPDLVVGICGEHGGDPESIAQVAAMGLDYVSCSPPRIPVARLAAAQAELERVVRDR